MLFSPLRILAVILLLLLLPVYHPAQASTHRVLPFSLSPLYQGSGYDVIAAVNSLRAANNLPAYEIDGALMSAAQGHSEYQASSGKPSHTGAGGSTPKSRAVAAGYGNGAAINVSENIASGTSMTPANAIQIWQGDSLHLNTMLSSNYTHAGAGIASDGRVTYITLDVGYITGQAGGTGSRSSQVPTASAVPGATNQTPANKPGQGFVLVPVTTVTPQTDGSIVHIVQPGEVLLNIAQAYGVSLSFLYELNGLNEKSVIYPGEKVKIKDPDPTPTATATPTETPIPTATRRPTRTPTFTPAATTPTPQATELPAEPVETVPSGIDPLLLAIILLMVIGISLVIAGALLRKK